MWVEERCPCHSCICSFFNTASAQKTDVIVILRYGRRVRFWRSGRCGRENFSLSIQCNVWAAPAAITPTARSTCSKWLKFEALRDPYMSITCHRYPTGNTSLNILLPCRRTNWSVKKYYLVYYVRRNKINIEMYDVLTHKYIPILFSEEGVANFRWNYLD